MQPADLKTELDTADLKLKHVGWWVQAATILATLAGLFSAYTAFKLAGFQGKLAELQSVEVQEKQRVSFKFQLTPIPLEDYRRAFYIRASLKNLSVKQLNLLMIGIRVWDGAQWHDDISVKGHLRDLIVSDNLVRDLPKKWEYGDKEAVRLRELDDITLEPTETGWEATFGPYPLKNTKGFWVTGRAYVSETEAGTCGIDLTRKPAPGVLPFVCEQRKDGTLDCTQTRCSVAIAPAYYYSIKQIPSFRKAGE